MKICFVATDNSYKSISFDFYTHDTAHLRELAIKSEIYELHSKLIDVGEKVKELNKNEVFEEERQVRFVPIYRWFIRTSFSLMSGASKSLLW